MHSAVPHTHPWDSDAKAASGHDAHTGDGAHDGHASFRDGLSVDHKGNGMALPTEALQDLQRGHGLGHDECRVGQGA